MTASRIIRDRHGALYDVLDRQRRPDAEWTSRMPAQIYDGGSMGPSGDLYFLAHPIVFAAAEKEGGADAGTVDTATSMTVFILGPKAPNVGDIVMAHAVGNRWVAEIGGAVPKKPCNCSWPCGAGTSVPSFIKVTDPVYGTFQLNLAVSGPTCIYVIDTHFHFDGKGTCPAGLVPIRMQIIAQGAQSIFQLFTNDYSQISVTCGNPPGLPAQTTCECNIDGAFPWCPDSADPFQLFLTCPTVLTTFPVPFWSSNPDICGIDQNGVSMVLDCTKLLNPARPAFSVTSNPIYMTCLDAGVSNPFYLLYGGCPGTSPQLPSPVCSVSPTWQFQAGPPRDVPCIVTINTAWCTCVAPGTITVTVQQTNAAGPVVCSGPADVFGKFQCAISSTGTYYITASTTAAGYTSAPVTQLITVISESVNPFTASCPLYPSELFATTALGACTLVPSGTAPICGLGTGSSQLYIGHIDSFGAGANACGCGPGMIGPIDVVFIPCNNPQAPLLAACFQCTTDPALLQDCPGTGGPVLDTNFSSVANLSGQLCFPMSLSGAVKVNASVATGGKPDCLGAALETCIPTSVPVAVTQ